MTFWASAAPALIGAVSSLFGANEAEDNSNAQQQRNIDMQKEFARNGIQWRVEDAKAAGLHPLFALGGSGATFSPNPVTVNDGGYADFGERMGQGINRAFQAQQTDGQRAAEQAQLALLKAQTDKEFAMASYYTSEAMRNAQSAGQTGSAPSVQTFPAAFPMVPGSVPLVDPGHVEGKADPVISARPYDSSTGAGRTPLWKEFDRGGGVHGVIPYTDDIGESMSEMGLLDPGTWLTFSENMRRYGWRWPIEMMVGRKLGGTEYRRAPSVRPDWDRGHDYPAGRYYNPRLIQDSWEKFGGRFRR